MIQRDLSFALSLALPLCLGLGLTAEAQASHNLLADGDFSTGVDGWTLDTDSGVELAWDSGRGDPVPGSLALSGEGAGFVAGHALSECFANPPDGLFEVRAQVLAMASEGTVQCRPYVTQYDGADCTGDRTFLGGSGVTPVNQLGVWEAKAFQTPSFPGSPSFRVSLFFRIVSGDGPASCNFDSVVLFEPGSEAVVEVPTVSWWGLVLLVAALGATAIWILRRGS